MKKNAVYYFQISLFVPEIFKFLKYANIEILKLKYCNQVGGDWKRMSCHGNRIFIAVGVLPLELLACQVSMVSAVK